ncbi:MAG: glycosyltransferase [Thermoplasmatales archaeon]
MIEKSVIITDSRLKTGIGRYAWNLYQFGFFEKFAHLSYEGISDFENHIYFTKHWGINTLTSYYVGGPYKKYVKKFDYVYVSSPSHFHLIKYNKNIAGTIHDFFPIQYPQTKYVKIWFEKNLKFLPELKGVVVISDYIKQQAEEMFKNIEFTRIHQWVNNNQFMPRNKNEIRKKLGLDNDKIYLLSVSRDVPHKNIDILPKIMNKLDDRFILIRIGEINRIINQFNNKKQIIPLIDIDDNIYPLYFNASNILIHTAIDGGFEAPFIEAMSSDLPVMTFNMPISREVLKDKAIYINFNKDDPNEWVDMIYKYYDKKIDYGDLKDYYKPERARKDYERFYKSLGWLR